MERHVITRFSDLLYQAERDRCPIPPLTEQQGDLTLDDAYHIQLQNVRRVVAAGETVSGKKIGLTSPGIQQQLGVNEPDYGHLFASMDCPGGSVDTAQLIQPKIEAELAFILSADLTGGAVTDADVRAATDCVVGAFEIVDSRVADWRIQLVDTVADNASSGRYILGDIRRKIGEVDLPGEQMRLYRNDQLVAEGTGAAVLGDPSRAVAWLANRLWSYGIPLKKGEVILSGAFSAAPPAESGDVFRVEFSSLGTIQAVFR